VPPTAPEQASSVLAIGSLIAQADHGGTAMVNVYQAAAPAPVDEATLAQAEALLAELPLDVVPPPAGLPASSSMPFLPNKLFVGREADLRELAEALKTGGTPVLGQSTAVTGMGGVGKSQLACEFAWRYGQYFAGGVFWLGCADPAEIPAEIATCGRGLNRPAGYTGLPLGEQVSLVAQAWYSQLPRLLVFDNCENEAVLEDWVPRGGGCRVLATARRGAWGPHLGVRAISLGNLTPAESVALLHRHRPDLAEDDPDLAAIAAELGNLPLALHLAGTYLALGRHQTFGRPATYLAALQRPGLLGHQSLTLEGRSPTGHEQHVARTFALSWKRLDPAVAADAMARTILARAAWFAAGEPIPCELLRVSTGVDDEDEAAAFGFARALARVQELGLATAQQDGALVLHRLVAAFIRSVNDSDVNETARTAVEQAVATAAREINKHGDPRPLLTWQLQLQLRAVAEAAEHDERPAAARLLNNLGYHLRVFADFAGARAAYERALAINERVRGLDHPYVARDVNNLGLVLRDRGDLAGARAAFERALVIYERVHGPDHPLVATLVNNLGAVLWNQGDLVGARAAYERERVIRLNNLGLVLQRQGDLAAYERALTISEQVLGPDHLDVETRLGLLGAVLWNQGDLVGARAAYERALAICRSRLGELHPRTDSVRRVLEAKASKIGGPSPG
jgi:tetratricopeptide (TPR) repeat protein